MKQQKKNSITRQHQIKKGESFLAFLSTFFSPSCFTSRPQGILSHSRNSVMVVAAETEEKKSEWYCKQSSTHHPTQSAAVTTYTNEYEHEDISRIKFCLHW